MGCENLSKYPRIPIIKIRSPQAKVNRLDLKKEIFLMLKLILTPIHRQFQDKFNLSLLTVAKEIRIK
jgi:hypothetical protein